MVQDLKAELIAEMKRVGAYDVGIADPHQGFVHAPEGRHPLTLVPECRSRVGSFKEGNDEQRILPI
jgi:hypothetical protein